MAALKQVVGAPGAGLVQISAVEVQVAVGRVRGEAVTVVVAVVVSVVCKAEPVRQKSQMSVSLMSVSLIQQMHAPLRRKLHKQGTATFVFCLSVYVRMSGVTKCNETHLLSPECVLRNVAQFEYELWSVPELLASLFRELRPLSASRDADSREPEEPKPPPDLKPLRPRPSSAAGGAKSYRDEKS